MSSTFLLLVAILCTLGVVSGSSFFINNFILCRFLGGLCVASCVVSLLNIGSIGINRYVFVCHNSSYSKIYTNINTRLFCAVPWVIGFMFDIPSYTGWSNHAFDQKTQKCLWDRNYAYSYTMTFVTGGVMLPLVAITICYLRIFHHIRKAKDNLAHLSPNNRHHRALFKSLKQAKLMFIIFVTFTSCWLPYIAVLVGDKSDSFPLWVHLYASLIAHIHASVNFMIYAVGNRNVREAYFAFIKSLFCFGPAMLCCQNANDDCFAEYGAHMNCGSPQKSNNCFRNKTSVKLQIQEPPVSVQCAE